MNLTKCFISRRYKKCVICGVRRLPSSNVFLSHFPLDPDQCRLWVKASGDEDLVHVPIEKLNQLKFLCGKHFTPNSFNAKGNRLLKHAVPLLHLPKPLDDELLTEFPLHMKVSGFKDTNNKDSPPCKKTKPNKPPVQQPKPVEQSTSIIEEPKPVEQSTSIIEEQSGAVKKDLDVSLRSTSPSLPSQLDIPDPEQKSGPFSWQKSLPICVEKDDVLSNTPQSTTEMPVVNLDAENKSNDLDNTVEAPSKLADEEDGEKNYVGEKHAEFSCDHCLGEIIGFRYTCVQCENFDLCCACEGGLRHPHHYMLRVPKPTPFSQMKSIIAAIRVKLKLLENCFKDNSGDWTDVVIKKEEDPLYVEEAVPPPATAEEPLEESVVPNADIYGSQQVNKQDAGSPLKDIQDEIFHLSPSTSKVQSSIPKGATSISKNRIQNEISDKCVIFPQNDVITNVNLVFSKRKDVLANSNVTCLKQKTNLNTRSMLKINAVSNKGELEQQNASCNLIFFRQKETIPKSVVEKYFQKDSSSNTKKIKLETVMKTGILRQKVSSENEMFEEYFDEVWLDESILAEDNNKKDTFPEAKQYEHILAEKYNEKV